MGKEVKKHGSRKGLGNGAWEKDFGDSHEDDTVGDDFANAGTATYIRAGPVCVHMRSYTGKNVRMIMEKMEEEREEQKKDDEVGGEIRGSLKQ